MHESFLSKHIKEPIFIIAEAGTAHGGNLEKAKELIHACYQAGVHCVKFQHVIASEILHPKVGKVTLPGGNISLYEKFKSLEQPISFFAELQQLCKALGIFFLCTPFGPQSFQDLASIQVDAMKIASPETNYASLVKLIGNYQKPVFLSSGVSEISDIEETTQWLKEAALKRTQLCLLHCLTKYPAPENESNLLVILSFAKQFQCQTGLSDHSLDPLFLPQMVNLLSSLIGQKTIIEKHITLSKGDQLDDPIAILPQELKAMTQELTAYRKTIKTKFKKEYIHLQSQIQHWLKEELSINDLQKRLTAFVCETTTYEHDRVSPIWGDGIKRLAKSETTNYLTTNRSLLATRDIAQGENISPLNASFLRSETMHPGMRCHDYSNKMIAKVNIMNGDAITKSKIH